MIYIIDANNLAGKMGILEEDRFDKILTDDVDKFFQEKSHEVFLVFDSSDPMGDQEQKEKIKVVFAPKDNKHYFCADDKILEIAKNKLVQINIGEGLTIVSDDIDLKDKIEKQAQEVERQNKLNFLSCSDFLEKINKTAENVNDDFFEPREAEKQDLSDEEQAEINEELRQIWN